MKPLNIQTNYNTSVTDYSSIKFNMDNLIYIIQNRYKLETNKIDDIKIVYIDLDILISKCNFNKKQMFVLLRIMEGYDNKYVAEKLDWYIQYRHPDGATETHPDAKQIDNTLRNICNKLLLCCECDYQDWLEINGMIKIPDDVKYYQCNACGRFRRAEMFNYIYKNGNNNNICKICD